MPSIQGCEGNHRDSVETTLSEHQNEEVLAPGVTEFDSAGIRIVTSTLERAMAPAAWSVDPVPELMLGAGPDPAEEFFGIAGLRGLADGGVLVVDGVSRELRSFDASGSLVRTAGGKGEGPGEFEGPALVPTVGSDSLLFWDTALRRFQLMGWETNDPKTFRPPGRWPAGGKAPLGAVGRTMLVRVPEILSPLVYRTQGVIDQEIDFIWLDLDSGLTTPIASFTDTTSYRHEARRFSGTWRIPFCAVSLAAATRETALVSGGRQYKIGEYNLEGDLIRFIRIDGETPPVTSAMIERALELAIEENGYSRSYAAERMEAMPIPPALPSFQSIHVDPNGWIWAEQYRWDPDLPVDWLLFDPAGRAQGRLRTPPGLEVRAIEDDCVVGVWRDAFGVEHVQRHRIHKPTDTG